MKYPDCGAESAENLSGILDSSDAERPTFSASTNGKVIFVPMQRTFLRHEKKKAFTAYSIEELKSDEDVYWLYEGHCC